MELSKPAGCFMQLLSLGVAGAAIALFGGGHYVWGSLVAALALWMLYQGGKPARRR